MINEKFYLAVPLGVLREFVKQNEGDPDNYLQLLELFPEHILSEEDLTVADGEIQRKGMIVIDEGNLFKEEE